MLKIVDLKEDLIEATVDLFYKEGKIDYKDTLIAFPSKRFQLFLQEKLNSKIKNNYFPPLMFPVEILLNNIFEINFPDYSYIDNIEASFYIYKSAIEIFSDSFYLGNNIETKGFYYFFPWAIELLSSVEEILKEGGKLENISTSSYKTFTELGDYHSNYKDFIIKLPQLIDKFIQEMEKNKKVTSGLIHNYIHSKINKKELILPDGIKNYIFSGFNALNKVEEDILLDIFKREEINSILVLRTDINSINEKNSPFYLQNQSLKKLNIEPEKISDNTSDWKCFGDKVKIYPVSNLETEMTVIYEVLKNIITNYDIDDYKKIGVVLPNPSSLIPFIQGVVSRFDIKKNNIPFNITLAYPFQRTPLFQLINNILTINEEIFTGKLTSKAYLDLIRHPYVKLSGEKEDNELLKRGIHIIENIIRKSNIIYLEIEEIENLLIDELSADSDKNNFELSDKIIEEVKLIHNRFFNFTSNSLIDLCQVLRKIIFFLMNKNSSSIFFEDYINTSAIVLDEIIDFIRENDIRNPGYEYYTNFIRYYFSKVRINFTGTPFQGIQVMEPLEFRGLQFDHVIIADCVEGIIPESKKYDPILPYDIRNIFKIRTYHDWETLFSYNFFSIVASSKTVDIFYPEYIDGKKTVRSRFIEKIIYEIEKKKKTVNNYKSLIIPEIIFSTEQNDLRIIKKTKKTFDIMNSDSFYFSPSSIEHYIKCPLMFYYSKILKLKKKEEVIEETDSITTGNIIHSALKKIYTSDISNLINNYKPLNNEISKIIIFFLKEEFRFFNLNPDKGILKIKFYLIKEKLTRFITGDIIRLGKNNMKIKELEREIWCSKYFNGIINKNIKFKGIIDRVDIYDKYYKIIDYKTGHSFSTKINKKKEKIFNKLIDINDEDYLKTLDKISTLYRGFQILLYIFLYKNVMNIPSYEFLEGEYIFIKEVENNKIYKDIFESSNGSLGFDEKKKTMDIFTENLQNVLEDILNRDSFIPNPDEKKCGYCPFFVTCGKM